MWVAASSRATRTKVGCQRGGRSAPSRKRANAAGSNGALLLQRDRRHHLIAGFGVGHAVHAGQHDVRVARQHLLDGAGEEVLAADAQPFGVATGEIDVAVGIHEAEVAGVEPPVAHALLGRLVVLVVSLEERTAAGVDDLADRLVCVQRVGRSRRSGRRAHSQPSSRRILTPGARPRLRGGSPSVREKPTPTSLEP